MWYYLSFAEPGQHLGAVVVEADDFLEAVRIAHLKGINPGGEVLGAALQEHVVPPDSFRNRLLTSIEARQACDIIDAKVKAVRK